MAEKYKYKAFISYSHCDEKWASWLHKALETYRVPKHLVGKATSAGQVPPRIAPIFRDRDELSSATNLGAVLTQALQASACQIVICSPNAARSRWTNEEILTFKRLGRSDRIFCLIIAGEPGDADLECFPPALIHEIGPDGELTGQRSEPIAADVRKGKDNRQNAKLKLIAGLLGVDFDSLKQREQQRHQRRMIAITTAAIAGMAVTSVLAAAAWFARLEAEEQRNRAQIEAETARQTTQFMVDLFKVSDPSEALGNSITVREILDKGAARIDDELTDQPVIQATLMDTMGTVYTSLGLYEPAVRLVESAAAKRRSLFGDEHPEVARSLTHLGVVRMLSASYDAAEQDLRESLSMRRRLFGDGSEEVAETASELADVLSRQGRYDDARPLIVEALDIRRGLHSEAHPDVAASLEDLGINDSDLGNYEAAVANLREALDLRRRIHGDVHPDLAEAINNLAWGLLDLGDPAEAESLYREALAMKRRLLGDLHPEIAIGLNNLAFALEMRGDYAQAEAAYLEALAMNRQLLGEQHPEIADVMGNLAFVLYAEGKHREALDLLRQALDMRREVLGANHPATAATATSLGFWLIDQGEHEEAESLLTESLRVRRDVLGDEHPDTAGTLTVLSSLMVATKRYEQGLEFAREAQDILSQSLPEGHWRIAAAQNAQGRALAGIGAFEQAEPLLLSSLAGLGQAPIPNLAAKSRLELAEFYSAWGKPEEAAKYSSFR